MTISSFKKLVFGVALSAGLGVANAAYLPFSITEDGIPDAGSNTVSGLGKITGSYNELFLVTDGTPTAGTFATSAFWDAGTINDVNGVAVTGDTSLGGVTSSGEKAGNKYMYAMYGLFQSSGSFSTSGTATSFTGSDGSIELWIDPNRDTLKNLTSGALAVTTSNDSDDFKIAFSSTFLSGDGLIKDGAFQGGFLLSFGDLTLTDPEGVGYFSSPSNFYMYVDITGQFNPFTPDPTNQAGSPINGSADVFFSVPEPSTLALIGLSFLGLAGIGRRKV